jgi:hypothetical protein
MVDRIDIGIDTEQETDTGFFTSQRTVTPEQYKSSFINFYNTALGLPSLEEETGIEVETPTVELAEPGVREPSDDDGPPNILEMTSLTTGEPMYEVQFVDGNQTQFESYSDYLKGTTYKDRIPFVQNILEPTMTGNFKDIKFGETVSAEVEAGIEAVKTGAKELPSSFELAAKRMTGKELTPAENAKLDKTYANITKGLLPLMGGIPGAIVSTVIGGRTVKNAFGKNSFLPTGPLGIMGEIIHAKQYAGMAKIRAARSAYAQGDMAGTELGPMNFSKVDVGFAMTIGNMGILREPGSGTFTGNTQGMDIQQLLALEAVSKGYDPTRGRYNPLNPSKNQTVAESGGMFVSDNPMDGFFRANGTFYSSRTGASAAYSNERDAEKAAATAGISYDQFQNALSAARSGSKTLDAAIRDIKGAKVAARDSDGPSAQPRQPITVTQARPGEMPQSEAAAKAQRESDSDDSGYSSNVGGGGVSQDVRDAISDAGIYSGGGRYGGFNQGGRVGLAMGGAPGAASGFVDRPPEQVPEDQTVADNRPAQLPEGAFVINAAAVEFAGSNDIKNMLLDAHKESMRRGLTVDKQGNGAKMIDVAISSGEVVVAPHLAKIIGYDRLEKINNRGKTETRERIEENGQAPAPATMQAATGMLISGQLSEPTLTQQDLRQQGFLSSEYPSMPDTPIPSRDEDTFFGYTIGELKEAIKGVEIKGFEKDPYIITGAARGKDKSSAFGPMQVTYSTLEDFQKRSPEYKLLDNDKKEYVNDLIQQGRDVVNYQKFGAVYRNGKRQKVSKQQAKNLKAYGSGTMDRARHEEHYDVVADMVLRLKLSDHENIKDALASYGEGQAYANKVLKGLE